MRYYKQRFGAQRAMVLTHNQNAVGRVLRQYKALGWGGDGGKSEVVIFKSIKIDNFRLTKLLRFTGEKDKF